MSIIHIVIIAAVVGSIIVFIKADKDMKTRIFAAALMPAVFQIILVYLVVLLNTGNDSWAGLGALLIGLVAIPATAATNIWLIKKMRPEPYTNMLLRSLLIAFILPILLTFLWVIG